MLYFICFMFALFAGFAGIHHFAPQYEGYIAFAGGALWSLVNLYGYVRRSKSAS